MIVGKELLRCDAFCFAGDLSEISYAQSLARGRAELRPGKFEHCVGRTLEDSSVQLPTFLLLFLLNFLFVCFQDRVFFFLCV